MPQYDAAVIGSGPGGYVAALRLAQLGKRTVLIEKDKLGGECTNYACIPSKALLHVAKILDYAEKAARYGVKLRVEAIDVEGLRKWRDSVVNSLSGGIKFLCDNYGVDVVQGEARLRSGREIEVRSDMVKSISASSIVLATGSKPIQLRGLEYDGETIIGSREAMEMRGIPRRLLIIGGGVVGVEAATLYSRLGSEVTIVEMMPQILPGADLEVARFMEKSLTQRGVKVLTNSRVESVDRKGGEAIVTAASRNGRVTVEADKVLVAVGRRPASEGLEVIGVNMDERGHVKVDKSMRTNAPGIYAVGDLVGPPYLAHKAMRQGKVAAEVIAGASSEFDSTYVPSVIYSDPEVVFVGLTEDEAKARGQVLIGRFPLSASGRARTMDEANGFVKVIADASDGRLLGIHMVGYGASELAAEAVMMLEFMATLDDVEMVIHPHPTLSEALLEAVEAARKRSVHIYQR
ncbi:MAG: dihydrolipoyl dehydrogenase [Thermocladium sp.]